MSNYNSLKTTIDANIKQNGNQEITGQILNSVLNQMVTTLGAGYQFAGVATTATDPGSPDAKMFYIANGKGTYTNFGGLEVTEDEVVVLYWDTAWHKEATGIASQEKLTELESKTDLISMSFNTKATMPLFEQINGYYYWYENGNKVSFGTTSITSPIQIKKGSLFAIYAKSANTMAVICTCDRNGNNVIPIVTGMSSSKKEIYYYYTNNDVFITSSYYTDEGADIKIIETSYNDTLDIAKSLQSLEIVKDIRRITPEFYNGKYIYNNGGLVENFGDGFVSENIALEKGEVIMANFCASSAFSAISKVDDGKYTPLCLGTSDYSVQIGLFVYKAEESCSIVLSGYKNSCVSVLVAKEGSIFEDIKSNESKLNEIISVSEYLEQSVNFNVGSFVHNDGAVWSGDIGFMSDIIHLQKNHSIKYVGSASSAFSAISKVEGVSYTPILLGKDTAHVVGEYEFTAYEDIDIVLSGYSRELDLTHVFIAEVSGEIPRLYDELNNNKDNFVNIVDGNIVSAFDNIICIGDSLTFSQVYTGNGKWRQAFKTYPQILASISGTTNVYNYAFGGATCKTNWDTFNQQYNTVAEKTNLVIIYLCTNNGLTDTIDADAPEGVPFRQWADTQTGCYCKIIQFFKYRNCKFLLVLPHAGGTATVDGATLEGTKAIIRKIAKRFECAVIDSADIVSDDLKYHYYPTLDGYNALHYNDLGYAQFAQSLARKVATLPTDEMKYLIPRYGAPDWGEGVPKT